MEFLSKSTLPVGESGSWKVSKFTVSQGEAKWHNIRCSVKREERGREIYPGEYTVISRNGQVIMSDVPAELMDLVGFVGRARGHVLITGLGMGMVACAMRDKPEVSSVTVIEKSTDVHKLVAEHIESDKLKIVIADAFEYNPEERLKELGIKKFDCAWHDIWDDICTDNLREMDRMGNHYSKRVKYSSKRQEYWCKRNCEVANSRS